jgi:hypothetical protein
VKYSVDGLGEPEGTKARSLRHVKNGDGTSCENPRTLQPKGYPARYALQCVRCGVLRRKPMSESLTVRITRSAHAALRSLAAETDESMTEVLDKAIEAYRRASFLAGLNGDFAALRQNRAAWEEGQQELRAWDATLSDGLED